MGPDSWDCTWFELLGRDSPREGERLSDDTLREIDFEQRLLVKSLVPVLFSDDQKIKGHILNQLQYLSEVLEARAAAKTKKKKVVT